MDRQLNNKIKEIGNRCYCNQEELNFFLPNECLRGSEYIFTIGHTNAYRHIDERVSDFVKGLHFIELKYKELNNLGRDDYGFGSPSPTAKVIDALEKTDLELAEKLRVWVKETGGNYYIK